LGRRSRALTRCRRRQCPCYRRASSAARHHWPLCSGSDRDLTNMARDRTRRTTALAFDAVTVEGALIAPAMLARIAQHQAGAQVEADYGVPKGLTLREEIARYFRIGQALFAD